MADVIGVTGFDDPVDEVPWAMPLAFLVDKSAPPTTTAVCEAAARATVLLLSDERSLTGEWRDSVARWEDGRIRKVVRRGKPALFERALHLDGVTVEHAGAVVRAFVPAPTAPLHADLKRLQVSGSELPELGSPAEEAFLTVALNPALEMSTGKKAAQCSHGSQLAWMHMAEADREAWRSKGFSVRVVHPSAAEWEDLLPLARERVVDAGFTEIPAGSNTVLALH